MLPHRLNSSAVEALKWVALACMLLDHVNAVFFVRELGTWATVAGRIAMPVFAIVLAYNLARPGIDPRAVASRLLLFGALALPAHALLFGWVGWWPLNIMATFCVAVGVIELQRRGEWLWSALVFVLGGALVEYWWPGVLVVVMAWHYFRRPDWLVLASLVASVALLELANGNGWALLALPLVAALGRFPLHVPRAGRFFWWFYPGHLAALAGVAVLLQ